MAASCWTGTSISAGEFYVQASAVAVEYPRGLRSEVDALLTYNMSGATPLLSGDVRVQRSAYTDPISLAALARANSAAVVRSSTATVGAGRHAPQRHGHHRGRHPRRQQLRPLRRRRPVPDRRHGGQPGMSGQATLREGGTIYAAGRTFTLTRGTISFTNLSRVEPDLDIAAETALGRSGHRHAHAAGHPGQVQLRADRPTTAALRRRSPPRCSAAACPAPTR